MPFPRRPVRGSSYGASPTRRFHLPLVTIDVTKDAFTPKQKQEPIARVTAA
jgi:hypothetical protein